jgi:hypothetical protein
MDLACFGQGTSISIINNSQSWLQIYRIGNPSYSVEVQKRWNQMITLPLAPGGGEDAQMIEISREGTSIVTPETSSRALTDPSPKTAPSRSMTAPSAYPTRIPEDPRPMRPIPPMPTIQTA